MNVRAISASHLNGNGKQVSEVSLRQFPGSFRRHLREPGRHLRVSLGSPYVSSIPKNHEQSRGLGIGARVQRQLGLPGFSGRAREVDTRAVCGAIESPDQLLEKTRVVDTHADDHQLED